MWYHPGGCLGTGGWGWVVACLIDFGASITDGPHRMSTGLPGGEKGEGHFWQKEQHEQSHGGGKSPGT